jgi:hypothetical protein
MMAASQAQGRLNYHPDQCSADFERKSTNAARLTSHTARSVSIIEGHRLLCSILEIDKGCYAGLKSRLS